MCLNHWVRKCTLPMLCCTQMRPGLCDPMAVAHKAPLAMGFSRQEYWSGLPFPSPQVPPSPGIEPASPTLAGGFFTTEPPEKKYIYICSFSDYFLL